MGRLADLREKCSSGVGPTCTESEFAEFQNLSHENSAASWFDRIMGGVSGISGIILRATGQPQQQYPGYYPYQQQPKQTSPVVWIAVVLGAVILIVVLVLIFRRKPGK